jgi:hypothetical protein
MRLAFASSESANRRSNAGRACCNAASGARNWNALRRRSRIPSGTMPTRARRMSDRRRPGRTICSRGILKRKLTRSLSRNGYRYSRRERICGNRCGRVSMTELHAFALSSRCGAIPNRDGDSRSLTVPICRQRLVRESDNQGGITLCEPRCLVYKRIANMTVP